MYQTIRKRLNGNPGANDALADVEQGNQEALQQVAVYLLAAMKADGNFATDVQKIADEINIHRVEDNSQFTQINKDHSTGYVTKTGDNNTNQFGNTIHYHGTPPQS